MNLSVIFSKLKLLFPVAVVASSIVITVKLLTSETPLTSEILKVEAKEDIHVTNFKDELVIPEEPPEEAPPDEKQPESLDSEKDEQTDDKEEKDSDDRKEEEDKGDENKSDSREKSEDEKKKDEKQEQQKSKRRFNPSNPLSGMLSKILGNKGQ
ncbi:hypothetical protein A6V39_05100 [Candidatus Mycoplasma haematobovis]|uniref:Uncharacterized protein n=1 Tax=Candidatus Mycoplasma haematobovis TaxID=432608 RepID=A0A1A9QCX6_9MOLU|nr:hypothetical protein [Candidatus Mycoplasma haematobovis]OAL09805.1 hypothetical protein A6V39_05100 [Candidatus Mycoplasma haematobovis]